MLSRHDPVLPCPCPKARTKSLPRSLFLASQGGTAILAPGGHSHSSHVLQGCGESTVGWGGTRKAWPSSLPLPGHLMTVAPRDSGCPAAVAASLLNLLVWEGDLGRSQDFMRTENLGPGDADVRPFAVYPLLGPPLSLMPESSPPALPLERAKAARHSQ